MNNLISISTGLVYKIAKNWDEKIGSSIPIVLECVASNKNEIKMIKNEIDFLRSI